MQSFFVSSCKECNEIKKLSSLIDKKIKEITKSSLFNKKYLTNKKVDKRQLMDLIYYKGIADNLQYDSEYYGSDYSRQTIISKIKSITASTVEDNYKDCNLFKVSSDSEITIPNTILTEEGYLLVTEEGQVITF